MVAVSSGKDSKQDYQTPKNFIQAVENRFGKISFDLAASAHNTQHERYFAAPGSEDLFAEGYDLFAQDLGALSKTVARRSIMWLNPEFKRIEPYAEKIATAKLVNEVRIGFLVPASIGSNWYRDFVYGKSATKHLHGRLCFDGIHPFPKDCLFALFGDSELGTTIWEWGRDI